MLLRSLLTDVVLFKDDLVILDMEAGLEHLGRATARGVDLMLVVVEPGSRAVETAESVRRMAAEIGLRQIAVVGNKVAHDADREFLEAAFAGWRYLGAIPQDETIRRADRECLPLVDIAEPPLAARYRAIWDAIKVSGGDAATTPTEGAAGNTGASA